MLSVCGGSVDFQLPPLVKHSGYVRRQLAQPPADGFCTDRFQTRFEVGSLSAFRDLLEVRFSSQRISLQKIPALMEVATAFEVLHLMNAPKLPAATFERVRKPPAELAAKRAGWPPAATPLNPVRQLSDQVQELAYQVKDVQPTSEDGLALLRQAQKLLQQLAESIDEKLPQQSTLTDDD